MLLDLVDVFVSGPLTGNPLAVVRGGEGLSDAEMLRLTDWLGFSETAFLLPPGDPGADYRVRIFCPGRELSFAGHPTLGSAFAWIAAGGVPRVPGVIVQQCGIGLVEVRQGGAGFAFRAPPLIRSGPLGAAEREAAARIAGVPAEAILAAVHADNGPGWRLLLLRSDEEVLAARPVARVEGTADIGLVGACAGGTADWEVRAFFADGLGVIREDPVTGSLNAAIAQYLFGQGLASGRYIAAQGRQVGASGLVEAWNGADGIWIGGHVRAVSLGGALTP